MKTETVQESIHWGREIMASMVVFLVALPLCMGIAIASGVPPALGLIAGIIGGLVVGLLAGAPLQVSGPAAGLTVLVYQIVQQHGIASLGLIVLIAGIMQIVAGAFKVGRWFRAISPAVVQGMLTGIGVLIFVSQFHVMVDDRPRSSGLRNLLSIPEAIMKGLLSTENTSHHIAARIGILTIVVIVLWNLFKPKRLQFFPGPFISIAVVMAVAAVLKLDTIQYIQVPKNLFASITMPSTDIWGKLAHPQIWGAAVALALVASAESLLCAVATDRLHTGTRADYDRELMAQGVGNALSGFLGALPITGVIVRSSANINAGAKTRYSGVIHGLWLLLFVMVFPGLLSKIPTAALAAILVFTGYKLMNFDVMKMFWKTSRSEFAIYAATALLIVGVDLLTGVIIGLVLSTFKFIYTFSYLEIQTEKKENNEVHIYLVGSATFVRLPQLAAVLESLPLQSEVHIHTQRMLYIDHSCLELLDGWAQQLDEAGGSLSIEWEALHNRFKSAKPKIPAKITS